MEIFRFHECSFGGIEIRGGDFPFRFGWQASTCPTSEGVGFEKTDVSDGLLIGHRSQPGKGMIEPSLFVSNPVERRLPFLRLYSGPPLRKPQLGFVVSTVVNEFFKFLISDQPRSELKRSNIFPVARTFVVEGKCPTFVANLSNAGVE